MALNTLLKTTINGSLTMIFGSQADAEKKLSLAVSFPEWLIEVTEGKGSKKKVTGYEPVEFSKRSVSSVLEFMAEDMPDRHLLKSIDQNLSGLRGQLGKIGITQLRNPEGSEVDSTTDEDGTVNYINVESVDEVVSILSTVFNKLTPAAGSLADPLLEAKKIFAKSSEYEKLDYSATAKVFAAWQEQELTRINRIMEKAGSLSSEDLRSYCSEKFLNNGVDEDGFLMLKGKKEDKSE